MNFVTQLPSQLILSDFLEGMMFTIEQSRRMMQSIIVDASVSYEEEMKYAKQFLTKMADTVVATNVISVKSEHDISETTKLMMIRFINIIYKAKRPIVINDEVVYLPKSLQAFDKVEVHDYIVACMRSVKHDLSVKVDIMVEVKPMPLPKSARLTSICAKVYDVSTVGKTANV